MKPKSDTVESTALNASSVQLEGHQLAERLRREGLTRARSIIAKAEREAQAAIRSAQEAAEAAEKQARIRAEAILEGRPLPPASAEPLPLGDESAGGGGMTRIRISALPADGSTLRYRISTPLSFPYLLRLKRDISQFPGVSNVSILPAEKDEATLTLKANDSAEAWRQLLAMPAFVEANP